MHDVAIVGYGPVGATLAGLLGKLGLDVVVFEKTTEIYPMPRAVGFDHDAMRIFQTIGISESIQPHIEPFREEIYLGADGRLLQHFKHMPKPYPLTWDPHFTCDQPAIERELRKRIGHMQNVLVNLGFEVQSFEQKLDLVKIYFNNANGQSDTCKAKYLVGCDGASSAIRGLLNLDLVSLNYDESWLVVDMKVNEDVLVKLPNTNIQYCDPTRPSTMICCPGNHRRWEFMKLPTDSTDTVIQTDMLWELMSPWIKPGDAEIWRAASYRFHALVAEKWQDHRVFLAGDSAHQTPPFIGQGMCQGIRDAGNLAWKLHKVITGEANEILLSTYTEERRPNVVATTQLAKDCGQMISERDLAKAKIRDAEIATETSGLGRMIIRQELIPSLEAGFFDFSTPLSGRVFPQPKVITADQSEVMLDDLCQANFRLILLVDRLDVEELQNFIAYVVSKRLNIILVQNDNPEHKYLYSNVAYVKESTPLIQHFLTTSSCVGAIVRPDHYVYCTFETLKNAKKQLTQLMVSLLKNG